MVLPTMVIPLGDASATGQVRTGPVQPPVEQPPQP